ncbi:hypothetical protein KEM55_000822 [Ascosphaera atra]|nr:hypothetical protein KEM55_000822 [Ascosphaera atra]
MTLSNFSIDIVFTSEEFGSCRGSTRSAYATPAQVMMPFRGKFVRFVHATVATRDRSESCASAGGGFMSKIDTFAPWARRERPAARPRPDEL